MKKLLIPIGISIALYFEASFTLIFWPVPEKKIIKNYDFSSIDKHQKINGQERWLTLRDKSKLFYRFFQSAANCTLIFVHGSGSESRYLENFAATISKNSLARVITPDLRGHGRTSKTKGDIDYLGQYEDDLEDLVLAVKAQYPNQKIILGGHSSGGGLALRYAGNPQLSGVDAYSYSRPISATKHLLLNPTVVDG